VNEGFSGGGFMRDGDQAKRGTQCPSSVMPRWQEKKVAISVYLGGSGGSQTFGRH